ERGWQAARRRWRRTDGWSRAARPTTRRPRRGRGRPRSRRRAAAAAPARTRSPRYRPRPQSCARRPRALLRRPSGTGSRSRRRRSSQPLDLQLEEVRRARDARVVVADGLLAQPTKLIVGELGVLRDDRTEVLLDRQLVLRRRRHDLRVDDGAVAVDAVPVVEQTAGGFGRAVADSADRLHRDEPGLGLLV